MRCIYSYLCYNNKSKTTRIMETVNESEDQPKYGTVQNIETICEYQIQRLRAEIKTTGRSAQITCSSDAAAVLRSVMAEQEELALYEAFYVLLLNRANHVISVAKIGQGGTTGVVVDAKMVLKHALLSVNCTSIVLCHNHPSGNLSPSQADIEITRKMKQAGKVIEISILDHVILSGIEDKHYSFADEGLML